MLPTASALRAKAFTDVARGSGSSASLASASNIGSSDFSHLSNASHSNFKKVQICSTSNTNNINIFAESNDAGMRLLDQQYQKRASDLSQWEAKIKQKEVELHQREAALTQREQDFEAVIFDAKNIPHHPVRRDSCDQYVTSPLLRAFGEEHVRGLEYRLRTFDFSAVDITAERVPDHLFLPFAPLYGGLCGQNVTKLPLALKVAIAGAVTALGKKVEEGVPLSWNSAQSALKNRNLTEKKGGDWTGSERIELEQDTPCILNNSVNEWMLSVLGMPENGQNLRDATRTLARAAETRRHDKGNFAALPVKLGGFRKTVLDVTVLRFPADDRRSFRLLHVKLSVATYECKSASFAVRTKERRKTVLNTELQFSGQFFPRESVIDIMDMEKRVEWAKACISMFNS